MDSLPGSVNIEIPQTSSGNSSDQEISVTLPTPEIVVTDESYEDPSWQEKLGYFLRFYLPFWTAYLIVGIMVMFYNPWLPFVVFVFPIWETVLYLLIASTVYQKYEEKHRWWHTELGPIWYNCYLRFYCALFPCIYYWGHSNPDDMPFTAQWAIALAGFLFNYFMIMIDMCGVCGCCRPDGFDMWFGRVNKPEYHAAVKRNLEELRSRPRGRGGFLFGLALGITAT